MELFRLNIRRLRMDLISVYKCLTGGGCKEDRARVSLVVLSDRTTGSRLKLKYRKFHLDKKNPNPKQQQQNLSVVLCGCFFGVCFFAFSFFTVSVTSYWNRLLRKVVKSPSLELLKRQLEAALRNLLQVNLLWVGGLTR